MNKLIVKKILSTVKTTLIAFLLALFVVTCIIINAVIPSESMEKTIMTGDRLIGNRLAYGINLQIGDKQICKKMRDPKRFDIIIFRYPDDESELYIKRAALVHTQSQKTLILSWETTGTVLMIPGSGTTPMSGSTRFWEKQCSDITLVSNLLNNERTFKKN